jgi:hypothetical protein
MINRIAYLVKLLSGTYIIVAGFLFLGGFGESLFPGLIPSAIPLPWNDPGDFISIPNGDVYANSKFFARIIRIDNTGHFVASYPYPSQDDDQKYVQLAVGENGSIYLKGRGVVYTCTADMQPLARFAQECAYWTFTEQDEVICGTTFAAPARVHRVARPGEPLFIRDNYPLREAFYGQDGTVLRREWLRFVTYREDTVLATYWPHWLLLSLTLPFPGVLCFLGAAMLYMGLPEPEQTLHDYLLSAWDRWISFVLLVGFHRTILCPHCWRYTSRFFSRYRYRKRFCEHCHQELEAIRIRGRLVVVFGIFPVRIDGTCYEITNPRFETLRCPNRLVVLANPGFNDPKHRLDISAIYLDCTTCDRQKLERGITYVNAYIPQRHLQKIQVFYQGSLDNLGEHLKNGLQSTFVHIHPIREA